MISKSVAWKRTAANAACSSCPPTGRPTSLSIWWFDVGWEIRTPHNKHREGWNREREGRKGRTIDRWTPLWLKMAAIFTADYEGRHSIHRKAVGVVYRPAQQNQEAHREVNQQVWCLREFCDQLPLCCLSVYYVCYRFSCQCHTLFVVSFSSKAKQIIWFDH